MQRRRLGELEVSAVGLGCATMTPFYDESGRDAAIDTLRRACEIGVDFLDSSDAYGQGRNEELNRSRGKGLSPRVRHRQQVRQSAGARRLTDIGRPAGIRQGVLRAQPEAARNRCHRPLLHPSCRSDRADRGPVGAMSDLVRHGKVRHLGICEAGAATIRRAHGTHPLSAVQIEYSLWTRDVEAEILPLCEELGIGFVAYSPLGRGFLTGKIADIAALRAGDARRNMPRFQGDNLRRNLALVEELKALAAAENCTPAQLALAWVLSRAPYIVPIPGTSHRHRLDENAAAVSLEISADTEDALLQVFAPGAASGLRYPENNLLRLGI